MDADKLKQTISNLYRWELYNYMLQECISKVEWYISSLVKEKYIPKPIKDSVYVKAEKFENDDENTFLNVGAFLGGILGFIIGKESVSFIRGILYIPVGFLVGVILGAILVKLLNLSFIKEAAAKRKHLELQAEEKYRMEMLEYERKCNAENARLERERQIRNRAIAAKGALKRELENSKYQLEQLYELTEIERNYRGLAQMGYMKELIEIEVATKLKGPDGLYYFVRKELRTDNLENILNGISASLNNIIKQNNRIYGELITEKEKSNKLNSLIINDSERIQSQQTPIRELIDRCR